MMKLNVPCVTLRQMGDFAGLFNREASWSVTSLQILESVDRYTGCSSGVLQETRFLLRIPSTNTLETTISRSFEVDTQ